MAELDERWKKVQGQNRHSVLLGLQHLLGIVKAQSKPCTGTSTLCIPLEKHVARLVEVGFPYILTPSQVHEPRSIVYST